SCACARESSRSSPVSAARKLSMVRRSGKAVSVAVVFGCFGACLRRVFFDTGIGGSLRDRLAVIFGGLLTWALTIMLAVRSERQAPWPPSRFSALPGCIARWHAAPILRERPP